MRWGLVIIFTLLSLASCGSEEDYQAWLVEQAEAASPEFCGDGIDDSLQTGGSAAGTKGSCPAGYMDAVIGNGCDKKCPGLDEDDDGYTSDGSAGNAGLAYKDCNDNDKRVIPGVYVPNDWTTPTGYKQCQTDGTYTSVVLNATTPLCEATGSGVCKYIDCGSGSNSNSGAYGSPYLTLGKVSGGSSGSPPASPFTLTAGSVVYILGTTTCSTTFTAGAGSAVGAIGVLGEFTVNGNSTDNITVKNYPGATAKLQTTDGTGILADGDYYNFDVLEMQTARSTVSNGTSIFITGSNVKTRRSYFHDMGGHGDNNDACVYCRHTNGCQIEHSFFKDCNRSTGNVDNIVSITWLDDDASGEGANHHAYWNTVWNTTYDDTNGMMCFKQKHGADAADVGANKHPVKWNTCINARRGVWWEGSSARIVQNVFWGAQTAVFYVVSDGGGADQEDNEFTDNTVIASGDIIWNPPAYVSTFQRLTLARNVVYDTRASYVSGNNQGVISIHGYGTSANRSYFETNNSISSDTNCWYNPNTGVIFSYYNQGENPGGQYTLAQWRSNVGEDANSYEENPSLDGNQAATSTHCTGYGRDYTLATATAQGSGGLGKRPNRGRFQ